MITVGRTINTTASKRVYEAALEHTSLGVQGANKFYGPYPIFFERAQQARLWDVDGNEFIDLAGCLGANILGHAQPEIVETLANTMRHEGVFIGNPTAKEVELANIFCELIPCAEHAYFTGGGGSDPIHFALRGAKALTGRKKIVKHEGSYHGWSDLVLLNVLSRPQVTGNADPVPSAESMGISDDVIENTIVLSANNESMAERLIRRHKDEIAAVIVEPIMHSMGVVPLTRSYLRLLRDLCSEFKIVLIFDEVLTGFRHALGGAQELLGVTPDLGVFGKAMTNGHAFMAALAGKKEFMTIFPEQAKLTGTFIASLVGCTAALKTIEILKRDEGAAHKRLYRLGAFAREGLNRVAKECDVRVRCHGYGSTWCLYPTEAEITCFRDLVQAVDYDKATAFAVAYRNWLINHNIFTMQGRVRAHLNTEHTEEDLDRVIDATRKFFTEYRSALN
jgi:glutamate-1-semialdehyde 2,1-aminomutase